MTELIEVPLDKMPAQVITDAKIFSIQENRFGQKSSCGIRGCEKAPIVYLVDTASNATLISMCGFHNLNLKWDTKKKILVPRFQVPAESNFIMTIEEALKSGLPVADSATK